MTVFQSAVDATFAAFGIDALYTPAGGEPVAVRLIARRPDTIVGFGDTRIPAETATFVVERNSVVPEKVAGGNVKLLAMTPDASIHCTGTLTPRRARG